MTSPDDAGGSSDGPPADRGAVLFDMDGVLVDSQRYWESFEEEYLFGELLGDEVDRSGITGRSVWDIHAHLVDEYDVGVSQADFIAAYHERAREIYFDEATATPGVADLIRSLRERGYPVGIVSSSPREWIGWVVEEFSLGPLELLWSAEDVDGPGKPDPHIYETAAAKLGVDPTRCVVVEDSENGMTAAVRAGAYVIGYRAAPGAAPEVARAVGADEVAVSPEQLRAAVEAAVAE
jgi:HAD superfamily hydrolase (TIGR01509 family)